MEIKVNNKVVKIPQKEIDCIFDGVIPNPTNEVVEELTKKAKDNKTTLINKARANVENKKTTRERKENPTKALIIAEIFNKLAEIEGISQLKVENKEKLITFSLNGNEYKLDLVQKRAKKA